MDDILQNFNVFGFIRALPGDELGITAWARTAIETDDMDECGEGIAVEETFDASRSVIQPDTGSCYVWQYRLCDPPEDVIYYYPVYAGYDAENLQALWETSDRFAESIFKVLEQIASYAGYELPAALRENLCFKMAFTFRG